MPLYKGESYENGYWLEIAVHAHRLNQQHVVQLPYH